ncbi:MAG: hypothetical protein EXR71_13465 [Myxococcales bacterium]|nr:hypothetical protein [Myxococcales bacterium]
MSFLKSLLHGRPNGLRARLFGKGTRSAAAPPRPEASFETGEKALGLRKEAPKNVTPPDGFEVVLHKDALPDGQIIEVIMGGTSVAVAHVGGVHYAIANTCAHAGGPLGDGKMTGTTVTCPYHGWKYDVTTGGCLTDASVSVRTFPVRIVGDAVCVQL